MAKLSDEARETMIKQLNTVRGVKALLSGLSKAQLEKAKQVFSCAVEEMIQEIDNQEADTKRQAELVKQTLKRLKEQGVSDSVIKSIMG
ncbi:MAG: hypothetical protein LRY75_16630 [Shewanella xiamenensis]|jgi:nitrate/TMAO reductase-like tetraheme cytochrome c subunit|uniref:DNA-binding protein H-NS-like N-terminal domain-containing protein n=2 Tax=Shewanella TaxID=22 RepID=A0AAE4Q3Q9_9GAMM|nr:MULTISPECIES: hypothetical protein [Shewanella]MCD8552110.1 hypothetical protein [Shewanella xiamenensis]MCD8560399.1 hypothetical protein [Shewanella xiamenensis]MCK7657648.1 hypothetical protein [Shewanella sp. JNE4-2]MCT8858163.1 hypothetical protein [Shewanella xiamenensis]MDH0451099.1 hypothetical protein [Shewanella sp. GD04112]